jgi:hypothetical protein
VPVATDSTQEYRDLRELLDTGSAGGAAPLEKAERKQALMVFGGAAAVVLLVIIGLVALPRGDGNDSGSETAAESTGAATGGESGDTGKASATATTAAPIATPAGLSSFQYEVPSANILPGLKPGDSVDFYNGPDLVAQQILVQALGAENEVLPGFPMRSLTIAATADDMRKLNSVTSKTKRSMATATTPTTAAPPPADSGTPPPSG